MPLEGDRVLNADERYLRLVSAAFVTDVRRTLDNEYTLTFRYSERDGWLWRTTWSTSRTVTEATVDETVFNQEPGRASLTLVQAILDFDFDHILEPWPCCQRHRDHPLQLDLFQEEPWWVCDRDHHPEAALGSLNKHESSYKALGSAPTSIDCACDRLPLHGDELGF